MMVDKLVDWSVEYLVLHSVEWSADMSVVVKEVRMVVRKE
jgi:hypothetical protein